MTQEKETNPILRLLAKTTVGAAMGAAGAIAGSDIKTGVLVGVVSVAASDAKPIMEMSGAYREWQAAKLWDRIISTEDTHTEAVRAVIDDSMKGEVKREFAAVVLESVRRVEDVLDEDVIPSLGILIRDYLDPLRMPDTFCRSVAKMLVDCDAQGLADLRATVATARNAEGGFPAISLVSAVIPGSVNPNEDAVPAVGATHALMVSDGAKRLPVTVKSTGRSGRIQEVTIGTKAASASDVASVPYDRASQVVQRLGMVGIGAPHGVWGAEGVNVRREVMERLAVILGAETPTT